MLLKKKEYVKRMFESWRQARQQERAGQRSLNLTTSRVMGWRISRTLSDIRREKQGRKTTGT